MRFRGPPLLVFQWITLTVLSNTNYMREGGHMTALVSRAHDSTTGATITEWECGTRLIHQETADHFILLDPEDRDFQPLAFLTEFGVDGSWSCETEHVGRVRVTHFRR